MIVVDASATIAMLLDEKTHFPDADDSFELLTENELIVPSHWPAEVGNALVINIRRARLTIDRLAAMAERLRIFNFAVRPPAPIEEIETRVGKAVELGLTYYDALYVQLADELQAPLFSLDNQMRKAAATIGVSVLPAFLVS